MLAVYLIVLVELSGKILPKCMASVKIKSVETLCIIAGLELNELNIS